MEGRDLKFEISKVKTGRGVWMVRESVSAVVALVLACVFLGTMFSVGWTRGAGGAPAGAGASIGGASIAAAAALPAMHAPSPAPIPAVGSTDYRKANTANSNQTAFAITEGVQFYSTLASTYTVNSLGGRNADRKRGLRIVFYGAGDDNDTATFKLWVLREVGPRGSGSPTSMLCQLYGFGTITLSTAVGDASAEVLATERFADTISWTVATTSSTYHGIGATVESCFGGYSAAYSPADNKPGCLIIPDLGNEGWYILEFNNASDANCRPNALVADEG